LSVILAQAAAAVMVKTQRRFDCEEIFSALLQLKDVSFIDPLLRFGHGFGLVVIPTGAGRFPVSCSAR